MMERIPETEWMDTPGEAIAYDQMDHAEVNTLFARDLLLAISPASGVVRAIDLGTGTAQIPMELCKRDERFHVMAVDAAQSMLDLAAENLSREGLTSRVELHCVDAKQLPERLGKFDVVMSNSLVHHLPEPRVFFEQATQVVAAGGLLFVRDLLRPATESDRDALVATYTTGATPAQRTMFADSLQAALTLDEVRRLVAERGFSPDEVTQTSDRHWTWCCRSE